MKLTATQTLLLVFACLFLATPAAAQEAYLLKSDGLVPLVSNAIRTRNSLAITNPVGQTHVYVRQAALDMKAGATTYEGYYCAAQRQSLLWPVSGDDRMKVRLDGQVNWRTTSMRIKRLGGKLPPATTAPGTSPSVKNPFGTGKISATGNLHFAAFKAGNTAAVALIDSRGLLQLYVDLNGAWKAQPVSCNTKFQPGSRLAVAPVPNAMPDVYLIDARGDLVEIAGCSRVRTLSDSKSPRFVAGGPLAVDPQSLLAFSVDSRGELWEIDLRRPSFFAVDRGLAPGSATAFLPAARMVFVVAKNGDLNGYEHTGGNWGRPFRIGGGFIAGSPVAAVLAPRVPRGRTEVQIAAIRNSGDLYVYRGAVRGWVGESFDPGKIKNGAAVSLSHHLGVLRATAVCANGDWQEWRHDGVKWQKHLIAAGFRNASPVSLVPVGPYAFARDRQGRIHAAKLVRGKWQTALCVPGAGAGAGVGVKPVLPVRRLVRKDISRRPLQAASVTLQNSSREQIIVMIHYADAAGAAPQEFTIEAGRTVAYTFQRDGGASCKNVYLVTNGLGRQREEIVPAPDLPPKQLYHLAVYTNPVVSKFIDGTGRQPTVIKRGRKSLGLIPLPAGELTRNGSTLDVYKDAVRRNNPGEVSRFNR